MTKTFKASGFLVCAAIAMGAMLVAPAHAQKPQARAATAPPAIELAEDTVATIEMYVGESRVIPYKGLAQIAVGTPKVVSAAGVEGKEILLFANDAGEATLHVWSGDGRRQRFKVVVRGADMARVNAELASLLASIPNATTRVVGDRIIVQGENLADQDQSQLKMLADRYPQIVDFTGKLGWEKMIELDVRVVEITTDKARQLGVAWDATTAGPTLGVAGDIRRNRIYTPIITSPGAPPASDQTAIRATSPVITPFHTYFGLWSVINSQINLLEQSGDAVVVARPRLTTRNDTQAEFQVGGQIPYSTTSSLGQTNVIFKDYGVLLRVRPRVDNTGAIRATLNAEVSEPDPSLSVNGQPGLLTRKVVSEFNVREGQTMILGGMLRRNHSRSVRQVPGLGSIPFIGELFRSRSTSTVETETLVFVTPHVVIPGQPDGLPQGEAMLDRARDIISPPEPPSTPVVPVQSDDYQH
ncbi:pilus assembly protein N-terminal domain-containing protein [soil metagenome]